jgi:hypothetical protein
MSAAKTTGSDCLVEIKFISGRGGAVSRRVGDPEVEFGLLPSRAIDAQLDLPRKGAFLHLSIDGRAGQAGAVEDCFEPDDAVWFGHCLGSIC